MSLLSDLFSGDLKVKRARNRMLVEMYEGGRRSRARGSASATWSTPEDSTKRHERLRLIQEAREMEEDFPLAELIFDTFETYSLGAVRYQPTTGNPALNREIMEWLKLWFTQCDATGRFDFQTLCRLALRGQMRDGECGFVHLHRGDHYELQLVGGDRIGDPTSPRIATPHDLNGIRVDDEGRVISYDIFSKEPDTWGYVFDRNVPREFFSHIFDPFRIDQYHGVSALKSVIPLMRDLKEVMDFSRVNIKLRASQLPYYKTEDGSFPNDNPNRLAYRDGVSMSPASASGGIDVVEIQGGEQRVLKTTEGVFDYPNDFPNQQFLPWVQSAVREIMCGVGLTYEFVYNSQGMTGTVGRLIVERTDRVMALARARMESQFMRLAITRAIRHGKDIGEIRSDSADLYRGEFFYGARISADYGRDARADIDLVKSGLLTETEYCHIHGKDPDSVRAIRLAEKIEWAEDGRVVADETGFPLNNAMNLIKQTYQVPPQMESVSAAATPDQVSGESESSAPAQKALIEQIGIGGSSALTAIVQSYGKGEMSRETAIEMIVTVFGMTRDSAEKIMGDGQIVSNSET